MMQVTEIVATEWIFKDASGNLLIKNKVSARVYVFIGLASCKIKRNT